MSAFHPDSTLEPVCNTGPAHSLAADRSPVASFTGMQTLSVSFANIAYVEFGGVGFGGESDVYGDNFKLAAAGVPEPASWALMIGGFGLVGAAARRRQSARVPSHKPCPAPPNTGPAGAILRGHLLCAEGMCTLANRALPSREGESEAGD